MSDIVNSGNHYCISLKGNQPKLLRQAQQSATVQVSESVDYSLLDSSHGRRVERRVRVFKAARELSQIWTNLAAFVEVERFGLRDGHSFHHRSWYILSHCIEPIWDLCDRQSSQHQPNKTKINLSSSMSKISFKVFN